MAIILWIFIILFAILTVAYIILNPERKTLTETTRSKLDGQFVQLSNGVTHYQLKGKQNDPLVVLVHGFSTPAYTWEPTCQPLVEAGLRVLTYDLFGRGYSDRPQVDYDLDLFVRQLAELLDALHIQQPIHLLGLSMGGPIVTAFTNRHPGKIQTLTLLDPLVVNIFEGGIFPLNIKGVGEYIMAVYLEPIYLPKAQCADLIHPEKFPGWENKFRDQIQYKGFGRAILSTMRNLAKINTLKEYEQLGKLNLPVQILWGKEDKTISAEAITTLRELVPNHHFQAIDDAGHIPHYEQPEAVNTALVTFFNENRYN
jgi:pimeloyl-ACP methyl ester carboxylesterase